MRALVQKVTDARLTINQNRERTIGHGLVVLLGIEEADGVDEVAICEKPE